MRYIWRLAGGDQHGSDNVDERMQQVYFRIEYLKLLSPLNSLSKHARGYCRLRLA